MEEKSNKYCDMDYLVCNIIKKIIKKLENENHKLSNELDELAILYNKERCH